MLYWISVEDPEHLDIDWHFAGLMMIKASPIISFRSLSVTFYL